MELAVPQLWDRQPWDTDLTWKVFRLWLVQAERPRNIHKAWKDHLGRSKTKSGANISAPSHIIQSYHAADAESNAHDNTFTWEARAEAYDSYQASLDAVKWERRKSQLREWEWEAASALLEKCWEMLSWPLATTEEQVSKDGREITYVVNPVKWRLADIRGFLESASKLARLATEMHQSKHQIDVGLDLSPEAVEALGMLRKSGIPDSAVVREFESVIIETANGLNRYPDDPD